MADHRFLPRFRALASISVVAGLALVAAGTVGVFQGFSRGGLIVAGALGLSLGLMYLLSPAWRLIVRTDNTHLRVMRRHDTVFSLRWDDVCKLFASAETHTCFVDGGIPERSLLIPGPDAPASYDLSDKNQLYRFILNHVADEKIEFVPSIELAAKADTTHPREES